VPVIAGGHHQRYRPRCLSSPTVTANVTAPSACYRPLFNNFKKEFLVLRRIVDSN
jgi:hypothetical protein